MEKSMSEEELLRDAVPVSEEELLKGAIPVSSATSQQQAQDGVDKEPEMGTSETVQRGVLSGLPGGDRLAAGIKTGIYNLEEATGYSSGAKHIFPTYAENLASVRERNTIAKSQSPYIYGGSQAVGATAGVIAAAALAPEIAATVGIAGPTTMGSAALGGATLGGLQGLSETEDLSDIGQDFKNTGIGALGGAIGGAAGAGAVGLGGKALGRVAKLKMFEKFLQGSASAQRGTVTAGSEAVADVARDAENTIQDGLLPKIKSIFKNLVGETDTATGARLPGEYDTLYNTAEQRMPEGTDTGKLLGRLEMMKAFIDHSPAESSFFEANGGMQQLENQIRSVKTAAGRILPGELDAAESVAAPEGILAAVSQKQPTKVSLSDIHNDLMQFRADKENPMAQRLAKIYDAHLDGELATIPDAGAGTLKQVKDQLDTKYQTLSSIMDRYGISRQMNDADNAAAARNITKDFVAAHSKDYNAMNDVSKIGSDLVKMDPETGSMLKTVADSTEDLTAAINRNKELPVYMQGLKSSGLGKGAISTEVGVAAGELKNLISKGVPGFQTIQKLMKGVGNIANSDPNTVKAVADHLLSSDNAVSKRMGDLLTKVAQTPDPMKRKALMFSLSQQPEFRKAMGNVFTSGADDINKIVNPQEEP